MEELTMFPHIRMLWFYSVLVYTTNNFPAMKSYTGKLFSRPIWTACLQLVSMLTDQSVDMMRRDEDIFLSLPKRKKGETLSPTC